MCYFLQRHPHSLAQGSRIIHSEKRPPLYKNPPVFTVRKMYVTTSHDTMPPYTIRMRQPLGRQPCRVCVEATDLITKISKEFPWSTHYHNASERRDMFTSHHHHGRSASMIGYKGHDKGSAWLDVKINNSFASHPVLSDRSDERYTYSWAAH